MLILFLGLTRKVRIPRKLQYRAGDDGNDETGERLHMPMPDQVHRQKVDTEDHDASQTHVDQTQPATFGGVAKLLRPQRRERHRRKRLSPKAGVVF